MEYKYIVYLTVNKVNGKIYVGVHKTTTPYKFDGYFGNGVKYKERISNPRFPFQKAFNKYGPSNFTRHTLSVFDVEDEAYKMEATIVTMQFVKSSKTYNVALGGGSGAGLHTCKTVYQYSTKGEYISEFSSIQEATLKCGGKDMSSSNISRCCNNLTGSAYGYLWSFDKFETLDITNVQYLKTTVFKYDLSGKFISEYDSLVNAAKSVGKTNTTPITSCLKGDRNKAYGFIWMYTYSDSVTPVKESYSVEVHRYTLDGEYIDSFVNAIKASEFLGKKISTNISSCMNGRRSQAGGYKWSYKKSIRL